MKRKQIKSALNKKKFKISIIAAFLILGSISVIAQQRYHQGTGTILTVPTSKSGVTKLNCDVRDISSYPLSVIVWDGATPGFFWKWTNGTTTYSGTVSLPSYAFAPDVAILYDWDIDHNKAAIVIVYTEINPGNTAFCNYVHYASWVYDHSNQTVSALNSEVDITTDCYKEDCASIDGDTRGYFAMAWANTGDLHTIAGTILLRLGTFDVDYGGDKTLNLPSISNCPDIAMPDVALYGYGAVASNNYIYYSYTRCGRTKLCEQTQNFDDIYSGSVPSVYSSHYETAPGNAIFDFPRIAANQYFAMGGPGNGAKKNEFTIVAQLNDVIGGQDYNSIYALTATNAGGNPNVLIYAPFNVNTNYYSPTISEFFVTSGTQFVTDENKLGILINQYPVVAYDRNNDHVVISWSMVYNEGVYPTSYPYGAFPAHVYSNPDYDGTNDPSMQPTFGISNCPYNSIDNTAANTNSDDVFYMAVSSHNTYNLLYAWMTGNGDLNYKVVTSGTQPRLEQNLLNGEIIYSNPFNPNNGKIQINVNPSERYKLAVQNMLGQELLYLDGCKDELETALTEG